MPPVSEMTSAPDEPAALPDNIAVAWCGKALAALSSLWVDDNASKTQRAIIAPYLLRSVRTLYARSDSVSDAHKAQIIAALKPASRIPE